MSTTKTSTHDLLERLFAAFNRHDADAVMSRMTVDVVFDAAVGPDAFGRRFVGRESVRDAFIQVWRNFPDVAGDVGLSEWIFRATRPDGGRIDADGCDIFEIEASLIKRKTAFRKDRPVQY